jgi:hypothetical protein
MSAALELRSLRDDAAHHRPWSQGRSAPLRPHPHRLARASGTARGRDRGRRTGVGARGQYLGLRHPPYLRCALLSRVNHPGKPPRTARTVHRRPPHRHAASVGSFVGRDACLGKSQELLQTGQYKGIATRRNVTKRCFMHAVDARASPTRALVEGTDQGTGATQPSRNEAAVTVC